MLFYDFITFRHILIIKNVSINAVGHTSHIIFHNHVERACQQAWHAGLLRHHYLLEINPLIAKCVIYIKKSIKVNELITNTFNV